MTLAATSTVEGRHDCSARRRDDAHQRAWTLTNGYRPS
jgi:hypothetical protein